MDMLESALRDLTLASMRDRDIVLKPEQDSAIRAHLSGRDVLAVLSTGYGKSLIYQLFVLAKDCHCAAEKYFQRPAAGDGISGLPCY